MCRVIWEYKKSVESLESFFHGLQTVMSSMGLAEVGGVGHLNDPCDDEWCVMLGEPKGGIIPKLERG